jgi:peptidoglycan/xylan/chitin deacetylase (PgdA/CDA1 family)
LKINEKIFISFVANIVMIVLVILVSLVTVIPKSYIPSWAIASDNVFYKGNSDNKNVSLMINCYWGTKEVEQILDILKEKEVKATFFLGGCWADDNNDLVVRMYEEGNEIGNHGYFHKDHTKLSKEKNIQEITLTSELIEKICGYKIKLFAPPSGAYNKATVNICNDLGYKVIMWSKDTIDWRDKDADLCYNRAIKNPENGDLILMHPMVHTVTALPKIIDFYKQKGYNIVTVTENIT